MQLLTSVITQFRVSEAYGLDMLPNLPSGKSYYLDNLVYQYPPVTEYPLPTIVYSITELSDILDLVVNGVAFRSYKVHGVKNNSTNLHEMHRKLDQVVPQGSAFYFRSRVYDMFTFGSATPWTPKNVGATLFYSVI